MSPQRRARNCRILFILKKRTSYSAYTAGFSSGLYNSAKFAADMLAAAGYTVKLVEVTDNNSIDREVSLFRPNIVIIEALWVVPQKFAILARLHPAVIWIVRVHSEAAFLAQEGIAIAWLSQYPLYPNVYVAVNSREAGHEVLTFWAAKHLDTSRLLYLPTFYPAPRRLRRQRRFSGTTINVACMGAIRPLKNHLLQAIAAMRFVDERGWKLRFHVNVTRNEAGGNAPYRSIVELFAGTDHELVQHDWMTHQDFLRFLEGIDLGLQVSFSETFDIVMADTVATGIPAVGSHAIRWLPRHAQASTISVLDIAGRMGQALGHPHRAKENLQALQRDSKESRQAWLEVIETLCQ
jgi:hypothetical protein